MTSSENDSRAKPSEVRTLAAELALTGPLTIARIAGHFGVSSRTLQRHLADQRGKQCGPIGPALCRLDRTFGVDARAAALLIAEFSTRLIARNGGWGRIVGLTSGGPNGFPGEVTYGAAKAALENYTMAAATELGRRGVTANMIHPPITDSGWVNDAVREFAATSHDHFHVAEPAEVAGVIAWLCSDSARMVTGNVIRMR